MASEINVASAVEFLERIFGAKPHGFLLTRRMDPTAPKGQENDPRYNRAVHFSAPKSLLSSPSWQEAAQENNVYFSACTVKSMESPRKDGHYVECPIVWFDLDALKILPINADSVYQELLDEGKVSIITRSSSKGIQGFFKLTDPIKLQGKKAIFNELVKPVLLNVAYYYGGDLAVCTVGNYMRIAGTNNVKKQYAESYQVRATHLPEEYEFESIKKRFPTNINVCPLPVWYGIALLAEEVWEEGMRHQFTIGLCGSLRKAGIDKESCKEAVRKIYHYLKHESIDSELATVDSTYEIEGDGDTKLQTLFSSFASIANKVEIIADWWVKYKTAYCRAVHIQWKPDNYDPRADPNKPTGAFWEDNMQTYYMASGKEGPYEKLFANFAIRMRGKLYDPISHEDVMVGEIITAGQSARLIEMPPDKHTSWEKFSTIRGLPSGVACYDRVMWQQFIGNLAQQNVDKENKIKVRHYGIIDPLTKPTLVMPETEHPKYTWLNAGVDTVLDAKVFRKPVSRDVAIPYLLGLSEHYPHYHEPKYVIPALGWFSASMISAFLRGIGDGFPTLMVCGLPGSGKSTLVKEVLAPHFGLKTPKDFGQTTKFALARMLTANNIFAGITDEFRDVREDKTQDLQSLIRSLWDGTERGFGIGGGETREERLVGTLCILGEHHYADEATLHRTFSIRIDRTWLDYVKRCTEKESEELQIHRDWLEDKRHTSILGNIVLHWISTHLNQIPDIIDAAKEMVATDTPIKNPRKHWGFVCLASGILLLSMIYRDYGLKFFVSRSKLAKALMQADNHIADFESYDTDTMRTLFQYTDYHIIQMVQRTGRTPEGTVYFFDRENPDLIHFEISRWHNGLIERMKKTSAAALLQLSTFTELLADNMKDPDSVVVGFDTHPASENTVAVSISRIKERYKIGVDQWRNLEYSVNEDTY